MLAWSQLEALHKPNAGVVAAYSEEGRLFSRRPEQGSPNRLMNTLRKPFIGPDPAKPVEAFRSPSGVASFSRFYSLFRGLQPIV